MKKIIILFFFSYIISLNYLNIPFEIKQNSFSLSNNFISLLLNNEIYSEFSLGTPSQIIKGYYHFLEIRSYVCDKKINGIFNEELSSTFKKEETERYYYNQPYTRGFESNDILTINSNNKKFIIENFSFSLATTLVENTTIREFNIGLKQNEFAILDNFTFFQQLKNNSLISSRVFSFNYNTKKFLIGNYPHEIDNKKYDKIYLRWGKIDILQRFSSWGYKWDVIYYNNKNNLDTYLGCNFNINIKGIIISNHYQNFLNNNFFDKYVKENKCAFQSLFFDKDYYYSYICDDDIDLNNFPILYFYSLEMDFSFNFTTKDLFLKEKNKLYCLLLFLQGNNKWILGEVFFKKYQLIFDLDKSILAIYIQNPKNNSNFYIYIIFLLIFIIAMLMILLIRCYYYLPRRKRANELEEQFEYISQANI